MGAKVKLEMSVEAYRSLAAYLERHEEDIAYEINDFEELHEVYVAVFDEEPKKLSHPMNNRRK